MEPVLLPVPRLEGSRIALIVETSNAENPTPDKYIAMYIIIQWGVLVALFLTISSNLRDSQAVKTKASRKRLCQYVCLMLLRQGQR